MSDRLVVWIEDLDGSEECPVCGHDFLNDYSRRRGSDWEEIDGYHYRSGGKTVYGCPEEGCEGKVEVTI